MRIDSSRLVILICVLALHACAAKPQLESRSSANPAKVDLSGEWHIRASGPAPLAREGEQPQTILMPKMPSASQSPQNQRRVSRSEEADVWIFLETGQAVKMTQTTDGLFISFDRSVVEAYTFGENRTVSVGPIEAQRVTGWIGAELVIETMGKRGAVLTETWALEEDGTVLVRNIRVIKGNAELFSARQVFDQA